MGGSKEAEGLERNLYGWLKGKFRPGCATKQLCIYNIKVFISKLFFPGTINAWAVLCGGWLAASQFN